MRATLAALGIVVLTFGACGGGDDGAGSAPVTQVSAAAAERYCDAVKQLRAGRMGMSEFKHIAPEDLKSDLEAIAVNNDPFDEHENRFDEFTRKACGFTNDDAPFPEE
jgi:hypothetical protein